MIGWLIIIGLLLLKQREAHWQQEIQEEGEIMSNEKEEAFTICQLKDRLLKGSEATGSDPFSVNLRVSCPQGKPIAIHHTHPGGEPVPSAQDVIEAKRLGLPFLCVSVPEKQITKCYPVR